ncbi:SDR family NAD(P)-dependent oxidoreductase [Pedobacter hartonius]|uniref:NAD(P)-dependent dehydrogenase, short-chain alcohol dehydrogenase family n=1 Tax=Pedobacter hartonius TaxID=425514 RepID=A0A1H4FPY6_9SPHI|nr:SDR family oxidoreductase [Pedobacter hartonius]SEA99345.1 NAD(P)-dependent dehydrogenase, short-chain alcohol dehydrogenase family [Pedobacter hartonius]
MIVLVTGGATGLGEAISRKIAQQPSDIVYFTYNSSNANAEIIESDFKNAIGIKCNFKDKQDVAELCNRISGLNIDVLINNAYSGDFLKSHFHKTPVDDFASGFNDNILPTIAITQAAINLFRKKKSGKIITILTAALVNTPPVGSSVYVANKAYIEELTKVWATENARFNITSNTISPAFMLTGFTKDIDERLVEQIQSNHPLKKLLVPEEVIGSVLFLMNSTQQINGINILLNSGSNIK